MKNRFWIYSILLLVILAVVLLWRPAQPPTNLEALHQTAGPTFSPTETTKASTNVGTTKANQKELIAATVTNLSPAELRNVQIKQAIEGKNVPISFYGRVIDQDSNGLPGVSIALRVMQPRVGIDYAISSNMPKFERTTDAGGNFSVEGIMGSSLDIESIAKDGYRLSPQARMIYGYGDISVPHHPDLQNPVILRMWKLGAIQTLISHSLSRIGIPVDDQSVQFDLFSGRKVSSGGQLIVRLRRDPRILPPRSPRYDWSMELEIPNGGFVTNSDEFMYQAPNGGYQEIFKFDMPKDAENWTTALDQQFYIQLENGKYFGSLAVHLSTIHDTPPLGLNLDIVINPSGSRSLQP